MMEKEMKYSTEERILSVYDMENFLQITKELSQEDLFELMDQIQCITIDTLLDLNPLMIKNLGDSNLIILNKEDIDQKINLLYQLKEKLESFLAEKKLPAKVSFSTHYGRVSLGKIGKPPFQQTDAFGEELNRLFLLLCKSSGGQFTVSQVLFDRLSSSTQTKFKGNVAIRGYIAE